MCNSNSSLSPSRKPKGYHPLLRDCCTPWRRRFKIGAAMMTNEERKAYYRKWRLKNCDKLRAKAKIYRTGNSELIKIRLRAIYLANKETYSKKSKEYVQKNREKVNERHRLYTRLHPEKKKQWSDKYRSSHPINLQLARVHHHNRRARKLQVGGTISSNLASKLIIIQGGKCPICKTSLKCSGFHLDHIIPLVRGGKNDNKNIQLLCPSCNLRKYNKDPIVFMQENGYLL